MAWTAGADRGDGLGAEAELFGQGVDDGSSRVVGSGRVYRADADGLRPEMLLAGGRGLVDRVALDLPIEPQRLAAGDDQRRGQALRSTGGRLCWVCSRSHWTSRTAGSSDRFTGPQGAKLRHRRRRIEPGRVVAAVRRGFRSAGCATGGRRGGRSRRPHPPARWVIAAEMQRGGVGACRGRSTEAPRPPARCAHRRSAVDRCAVRSSGSSRASSRLTPAR